MKGFLPEQDPLSQLPLAFDAWQTIANALPQQLLNIHFRAQIEQLPVFPVDQLPSEAELECAMRLLSYLGHAYVWATGSEPAQQLPIHLATAWHAVAEKIGRPPVLSYASYALNNWYRMDPEGPIALGNIGLLQNFLGGIDEEWFILIHVDIEQRAIPAIQALLPAQKAIEQQDEDSLLQALQAIEQALAAMVTTLKRMPEHCDPYIYYHRVRPYIHGWKNNPALPDGIVYTGVDAYQNKPVKFKGETGAQSTIIPMLDVFLGITHANNPLKAHLEEMRQYMPPKHRHFLETVEQGGSIRDFILNNPSSALRTIYNQLIELIHEFRSVHIQYAAKYIQQQHLSSAGNPTDVGTGGTPFMSYLHKHQAETLTFLLK